MKSSVARTLAAALDPVPAEMELILAARWNELPASLRVPHQVVGRFHAHCGYTMGPASCSFGCTHCYLPANANAAPLPSLAEMRVQIDANRRLLGPGGALQITGGDVLDAYVEARRESELLEVVRHAVDVGLVPMVMTHGQKLLDDPGLLGRLLERGRLRKIAIHIDSTQAGRPGFPLAQVSSEADLHPLRARFVELVRDTRRRTGLGCSAAHTVTVVEGNLDSIPEILRWMLASPEHLDVFRMISFQPEADVGRTRFSRRPVTAETTWAAIESGVGRALPREATIHGHPKCSSMVNILVLWRRDGTVQTAPLVGDDPKSRAWQAELLRLFGGVGGRGANQAEAWARKVGVAVRHPWFLVRSARHLFGRVRAGGISLIEAAVAALRGRVKVLNIVMHNFMSSAEVEAGGAEVEARLAACSFRGAAKVGGEWKAVPMCEMNAVLREEIYRSEIVQLGARRRA